MFDFVTRVHHRIEAVYNANRISTTCVSFLFLILAICLPKYLLNEPINEPIDVDKLSPPSVNLVVLAGIVDDKPNVKEEILKMPEFYRSAYVRRNYSEFESHFLEWLASRLLLDYYKDQYYLSDLLRVVSKGKIYSSCAVVGDSPIVGNFGEEIDSHDAVIRIENPAGSIGQFVGTKTTFLFMEGNSLRLCNSITRSPARHGEDTVIVVHIRDLNDFIYVPICKSNQVVITHPMFDLLSYQTAKYYSLKRWYELDDNLDNWKNYYQSNFRYSSRLQAVLMASGICQSISLYEIDDHCVSDVYDYQGEMNLYKDLANSSSDIDIPFLSGYDKARLPALLIKS